MADKLIDLHNRILKYNNDTVYIAFHTKTQEPYFHAKQLCILLGYSDFKKAIKKHINKQDIFYIKDIVKNYKILYSNIQPHTKFVNESGLYDLIIYSQQKYAIEIKDWITHEVMPSLRKFGEYKLTHKYKKQIDYLNEKINELQEENKILTHNLKKTKLPKSGIVYIMRVIDKTLNIDENEILYLKFGRTKNINKRKSTYETCVKNKIQILKTIKVKNPKNIETCVIEKMKEYQIQHKKEYYKCSYKQLIDEIASCVNFYETDTIDKKMNVTELKRQNINPYTTSEIMFNIKIINDEEYNLLCGNNLNYDSIISNNSDDDYDSDVLNDSDDDYDSDVSNNSADDYDSNVLNNSDDENINETQDGGTTCNDEYKAYKYKLKYVSLKYELLNMTN